MEIITCLACGGDESLLVCSEEECGFAVHENCLPCSAYFNASGSFYCPQCSYELAVEECIQAKKRASLAKQTLLKFISAAGSIDQLAQVEAANRKQSPSETDNRCPDQIGGVLEQENSEFRKGADLPDNRQKSEIPVNPGLTEKCHETEMRFMIGLPTPGISIAIQQKKDTDEMLEEASGKDKLFVEDSSISDSHSGTTVNKKLNAKRLRNGKRVKYVQRSSSDSDVQNGTDDESVKQRQDRDLATSSLKRNIRNSDKRSVSVTPTTKIRRWKPWSDKEIEILKEGVQKFSVPNTKMPWNRILEYGSNVFEHHRTAVDLKDKWRNLTK